MEDDEMRIARLQREKAELIRLLLTARRIMAAHGIKASDIPAAIDAALLEANAA